jgi:hypothetical protein
MTAAEGIRTVAMTADQKIGISAGRAMVIERVTATNNNKVRVRDLVDRSKIEDRSKVDLGDHSNNRAKDLHRKTVDLGKGKVIKDLVDRSKIEDLNKVDLADLNSNRDNKDLADQDHKDLQGINKIVGHNRDNKDLVDQDHSLILDKPMLQRMIHQHQRIRLRIKK